MTPSAENLIRTMFVQMGEIASGASRPAVDGKSRITTLGVVGAGMMGRGIAYSAAAAGIKVILKDITIRSEEHTYELQSLMRISYAVCCLQKKHKTIK